MKTGSGDDRVYGDCAEESERSPVTERTRKYYSQLVNFVILGSIIWNLLRSGSHLFCYIYIFGNPLASVARDVPRHSPPPNYDPENDEFLDQLNYYYLLRNEYLLWGWLVGWLVGCAARISVTGLHPQSPRHFARKLSARVSLTLRSPCPSHVITAM